MIQKTDQDAIQGYLSDASNAPGGRADAVFFPESEQDVVAVVEECRRRKWAITVSGAGTGLAGGRVPYDGAVIATERMNNILNIDSQRYRAVVQPGVVVGDFQQEVERHNLLYPPDPTERSSFIGGNVATNASGARTFKYGPTRHFIQRLRLVTSDADVIELERGVQRADDGRLSFSSCSGTRYDIQLPSYSMPDLKHAAGYFVKPGMDAIDLVIGSEGTLGIVTEVEARLLDLPERLFSGIVFFPNEGATLRFVEAARARSRASRGGSNDVPDIEARALEFMDRASLDLIFHRYPEIPNAAQGGAVWFEQESTEGAEDVLLEKWYRLIVETGGLVDQSWFAISPDDQRRMRQFRHAIPESVYEYLTDHGQVKLGTDMAVPDQHLRTLMDFYRSTLAEASIRAVTYGHIGNAHLHVNMLCTGADEYQRALDAYGRMVRAALSLGGTISAEHGVGKIKKDYLRMMFGDEAIAEMRAVKRVFDPRGVLGRGTMFDS